MITNYFNYLQEDIIVAGWEIHRRTHSAPPAGNIPPPGDNIPEVNPRRDTIMRVNIAVLRLLASLVMGVGVLGVAHAAPLVLTSPAGAVLQAALFAVLYFLGHDIFRIATNVSINLTGPQNPMELYQRILTMAQSILLPDAPPDEMPEVIPLLQGAYYKPFWKELCIVNQERAHGMMAQLYQHELV